MKICQFVYSIVVGCDEAELELGLGEGGLSAQLE